MEYLTLLRPRQWIKNILVLAPAFFAVKILEPTVFASALLAAVLFSLTASVVYIGNDIVDRARDAEHPKKRFRPIAAGVVSPVRASVLGGVLLLVVLVGTWHLLPALLPYLLVYLLVNIVYSLWAKHIPVLDVVLIASLYVLRVLAGGAAAGVGVSDWLLLCTLFLMLLLVLGKRRAEFRHGAVRRGVLNLYTEELCDELIVIAASLSLVSYSLYSILAPHHHFVVYSLPFALYAIMRYVFLVRSGSDVTETPERVILEDTGIRTALLLWVLYLFVLYYNLL